MKVQFWGVRGSHPQCGEEFKSVGGDTSCVTVEVENQLIILDAGTGIIEAGQYMMEQGYDKATLLISHPHADHINGLAFFEPIHQEGIELTFISGGLRAHGGLEKILSTYLSPPYFPIPWDKIPSHRKCLDVSIGSSFSLEGVHVSTLLLDHPGGSCGYRLDVGPASLCYITDVNHRAGHLDGNLVAFIERTNLLIYDAMFTEEEFEKFSTWGHSTWKQGVALAKAAAVKQLALFHHHPNHDDLFMTDLEKGAQSHFSQVFVARQRQSLMI